MTKFMKMDETQISTFCHGQHFHSYNVFGAHRGKFDNRIGVNFALWAPDVKGVQVVGDFNSWQGSEHQMTEIFPGFWQLFVPKLSYGEIYKYQIETHDGRVFLKSDPYAFQSEVRPNTASVVADLNSYKWGDASFMRKRKATNHFEKPLNIYEVHLGSWAQHDVLEPSILETPIERFYTYREMAEKLVPYVKEMGYTHLEIMPVMEHPFDGSWGYQVTGYFSATARYGTPQDFMYLVDTCHQAGIGVILDWVPGHFCPDAHGLSSFNGNMLYEREYHAEWGTYKFNFSRGEVRSFLFSSASFWFDKYHVDGIRVDGVTSMVYLNYGHSNANDHTYNKNGGVEDLDAMSFLSHLNHNIATMYKGTMSIAEESTALPLVTYPPDKGGLGFHYKWDMGWMNDTLEYMSRDFPFRPYHHNELTFSSMYAFNENFILPFSHDEVVHGKKSLIGRMPGDYWRQFANARLLYLYQMTHTGAKLNFMGNEIAQFIEWRYYEGIEFFLTKYEKHEQFQLFSKELNYLYLHEKALWEISYTYEGFDWIEADNNHQGCLIYQRKGKKPDDFLIVVLNFHPETYHDYEIGVPKDCEYVEIFNTDKDIYGGSGKLNPKKIKSTPSNIHGQKQSVRMTIPPIGGVILKPVKKTTRRTKKSTT